MLKTKSVHSPIESADGLRILVARFRGRGLPVDRYDVWMASLGPSERLLRRFLAEEISWREFSQHYRAEMAGSPAADRDNTTIKNHGQKFTLRLIRKLSEQGGVTLLCHCAEDEPHCHRHVLRALIAGI